MEDYKFLLIYGEFLNEEKRAAEFLTEKFSEYHGYALPQKSAKEVTKDDLSGNHLIILGTSVTNSLLKSLEDEKAYTSPKDDQGYTIKISQSIYNEELKMIIICGKDSPGCMYGAVEFSDYVTSYLDTKDPLQRYPENVFSKEHLENYEITDAPSLKNRGIWTWGHVVYDYKRYIKNMAKLKFNTLILWNDCLPVNIGDVIDEAHSYGIKIYLGYSWGWNEARPENGGLDISDERILSDIQEAIVENYKKDFLHLPIDGIYFQSFTETEKYEINGVVIAKRVVDFVNDTADRILSISPDLLLMFGLHASSVSEKMEYIRNTDKRIMIVWEDLPSFPYSYTPRMLSGFDETVEKSKEIASLREKDELFGVVTKGLTCLDWETFSHMDGEFAMGMSSDEFIKERFHQKEKLWKYVDAFWVKNASYAKDVIKLLAASNKKTLVTGLIEDGVIEEKIPLSVRIFSELLWNAKEETDEIILKAMLI
ncbi:MAG: hypothetical protein E7394_02735 [Ruminococcaceae bacterium]|nr:hypothetical protein [Oscillospiraceae bacterium]